MKPSRSHFALYLYSIIGALVITISLMMLVIRPPLVDLMYLALFLALTGAVSAVLGYFSNRLGWWHYLPSLKHAFVIGYVLAAVLILLNVWITAELMFVNAHDLALAVLLLLFASGISISFGYFIAGSVTQALGELVEGTYRVGKGDLSTRVAVRGEDEIAKLAGTFNLMAEQLEQAAAEREALEAARRNFVAWASHDLRTPLASLRVMVDALADGIVSDAETTQRYIRQSQVEINRLSELVDNLFELAQLDAGRPRLYRESSSLSDLISDTLAAFMARAAAKGITLKGSSAPEVDPVWMAPDKISRVLYNLLANAIRHTPPGGEITLEAHAKGNHVMVVVRDTGQGILPDDLPHIFDRFYRGQKSRSRDGYESSEAGLGLAIVKGLVESHGGRIWAESEAGKGTVFRFTLPKEQNDLAQPTTAHEALEQRTPTP